MNKPEVIQVCFFYEKKTKLTRTIEFGPHVQNLTAKVPDRNKSDIPHILKFYKEKEIKKPGLFVKLLNYKKSEYWINNIHF